MPHSVPDLEKDETSSEAERGGKGRKIEKVFPRLESLGKLSRGAGSFSTWNDSQRRSD
jgi:hypothetical protein